MTDVMVKCKRCGNLASASLMKLDPDFRMVVCFECIKSKSRKKEEAKQAAMPPVVKINYRCKSCKYEFSRSREAGPQIQCPYCSKATIEIV